MPRTAHRLLFLSLLTIMASLAYGINYMYFSHFERTSFNDIIRFWHEDMLAGPVRSNSQIGIMENPVFYDYVMQGGMWTDFEHGPGYNPLFLGPDPLFRAQNLPFPETASVIRERALEQDYYFNAGPNMLAWVRLSHDTLKLAWIEEDQPIDSLPAFEDILLPDTAFVFFEATLRISGTVSTVLTLGASGRIGLEDNILYASTVSQEGMPVAGHPEKLALVSENEIKILNTQANGRNDEWRYPFEPPDSMNAADIALNGIFVAMNESFTFENQNDPDSGYQGPSHDERGNIYLWGSLMQKRRSYIHRSNHLGTGYGKQYRYDEDLRFWNVPLWSDTLQENAVDPAGLEFGEIFIGDTLWREVVVTNDFIPVWLTPITVNSGFGFFTPVDSLSSDWEHHIQVGFSPHAPGLDLGELRVDIPYYNQSFTIALEGTGITTAVEDPFIPHPSSFGLSAFPNPFNAATRISYSLPQRSFIELAVFDLTGRRIRTLVQGDRDAGVHHVSFNAADLPSGLYFVRLLTAERVLTQKLLLVK